MARWHQLEPVDSSYFTTAPLIYRYPVDLDASAERVWESLTSDDSVAPWSPLVSAVRWTSPRPFGVGTTREVDLPLHSMTVREHFFRWDEGSGYSFYLTHANRPLVTSVAEDYVVQERPGGGCRFTWTIAVTPNKYSRVPLTLGSPLNRLLMGGLPRGASRYFAKAF